MYVRFYLLVLSFSVSLIHAQTPDSNGVQYVVDTIAAPNCYQSADGAILLNNVSVPGIIDRYEWSDGSSMEDLIFVNGGVYQLTVYNTDGESFTTEEFFIPEPDSLVIKPFISSPTSDELDNGFIDLTFSGGTAPYELTIIFNQDTTVVNSDSLYRVNQVDTGLYVFSVLDARGCVDTSQFEVSSRPCGLLVTALIDPAECSNAPSGRIELLIENAVEPYTIDWDSESHHRNILTNLSAGLYHFSITDRRNCNVVDSIEIVYDDRVPPRAFVKDNVVLFLDSEGKAEIQPKDILIGARDECHNNLTYKFEKNTFTCDDVGVRNVNFFVIDGVGNSTSIPIEIELRDTAAVKLIYQDTVYTALCNGIAQYAPPQVQGSCANPSSGGIVKLTNREITSPGIYEDRYYYIRSKGDTLRANVIVNVADTRVRSFLIVTEPQCNRGDDGSIAVALRNSSSPVSYEWNNGATDDFIFGIYNQRDYSVTVREGNGCVFEFSAFIEGPDSLNVELRDVIEKEDAIDIIPDVNGGNPPFQYAWYQNGVEISDSKNLLNVSDGQRYRLLVTDAEGCLSNPLIVDRAMTSAGQDLENEIEVFPNPVLGNSLIVRFRLNEAAYSSVRLINSQHQVIKDVKVLDTELHMDLQAYPPGIYIIQFVRKDGRMFSKKVIRI